MKLGSLFDGIGGWLLAAQHAGIEPIWASEIAPFPASVTAHHFPNVVQLGDITKLDGAKLWPVDIICAGSPCQNLSVAGNRKGLQGEQSGLFMYAIRLVRDMRRRSGGQAPRFFVWENVPGAFSSNKGADFRAVLSEITETEIPMPENKKWADAGMVEWDGGSLAWRVLDAQYWGVPQRRRRIFLVADFGGHSAGEILFERESVRGDSAESGEAREGTAAGIGRSIETASTLRANAGAPKHISDIVGRLVVNNSEYIPEKDRRLTARNDGSPCVDRGPDIVAAGFKHKASPSAGNIGYKLEAAPTLMEGQESAVAVYDMTHADEVMRPVEGGKCQTLNARMGTGGNQVPVVSYAIAGNVIGREDKNGGHHMGVDQDVSFTLNTVDRHAVAAFAETSFGALRKDTVAGTQKESGGGMGGGSETLVCQKSVRRLTPTECERLQGLPDGYTLIDDKTCSDTARYKALGNGMAQPCADYVIKRIVEVSAGD